MNTLLSLPQDLAQSSLADKSKFLWEQGCVFAEETARGDRQVTKVIVWNPAERASISKLLMPDLAFGTVIDHMNLADPNFWCAPFPAFLRLTCLWRDLHKNPSKYQPHIHLLKDKSKEDAYVWTYWLHSQGIRHHDYLIAN